MESFNYIWQDKKHFLWLPWSFTTYKLAKDRLFVETGLLFTSYDENYLYRILDVRLERSLLQKICGTGTVVLIGTDASNPALKLENIGRPLEVKEMLSRMSQQARKENRVLELSGTELDLQDLNGDGFPDFLH